VKVPRQPAPAKTATVAKPAQVAKGATTDRQVLLASACGNDQKCACINNAIFIHDSSWATKGVGARFNNPGNMRPPSSWSPSVSFTVGQTANGPFAKFATLEDGIIANVELYKRFYADLPPQKLVTRWAGGGGNSSYRSAVASCF
jgi:hypothetical protein